MNDEYVMRAARKMIVSDISSATGYRANNSLAGALVGLQHQVPRWAAEAAVRAAVARGTTFRGARVSFNQLEYLRYVATHPGCCIADVDRACRQDARAGHKWVYASVRRLVRRGLLCAGSGPGNRVTLHVPSVEAIVATSR